VGTPRFADCRCYSPLRSSGTFAKLLEQSGVRRTADQGSPVAGLKATAPMLPAAFDNVSRSPKAPDEVWLPPPRRDR